jgi:hypothetical protein
VEIKYDGMAGHNDEAPDVVRGLLMVEVPDQVRDGTAFSQMSNFTPCASGSSAE